MKLLRYRTDETGNWRGGIMDDEGNIRYLGNGDLAAPMLVPEALEGLRRLKISELEPVARPVTLSWPFAGIGKIIGVGLNYRAHAEECRLPVPIEPTLFLKATSALSGPRDGVLMPIEATRLDWEVELGVVIGSPCAYVSENEALSHVAGYCLGIDFSERAFQFDRGGQGFKGKSCDTFAPLGPWFVTADEIAEPQSLELGLTVNGEVRQLGNTSDMIFAIAELVAYCSRFMSLHPGDVILTGTPAGVGMGQRPETYLQIGDRVEAWGSGLGRQSHEVRSPRGL